MLLLDKPSRADAGYVSAVHVTSITIGLVIVFTLSNSSTTNTTQNTISPAVDIALGAIALAGAFVLYTGRHERLNERRRARKAAKADKAPPRWQRELSKGSARTTFVIGALLTLPGASYLAGLDQIHKLKYSTTVTVLIVIGFNLVMLWLLRGSARQLPGRPGMDTTRDRSSQDLGQPPRTRVRGARTRRGRHTPDHQGPDRAAGMNRPWLEQPRSRPRVADGSCIERTVGALRHRVPDPCPGDEIRWRPSELAAAATADPQAAIAERLCPRGESPCRVYGLNLVALRDARPERRRTARGDRSGWGRDSLGAVASLFALPGHR